MRRIPCSLAVIGTGLILLFAEDLRITDTSVENDGRIHVRFSGESNGVYTLLHGDTVMTITAELDRVTNSTVQGEMTAPGTLLTNDTAFFQVQRVGTLVTVPSQPNVPAPPTATRSTSVPLQGIAGPGVHVRIDGGASPVLLTVGPDGAFAVDVPLQTNKLNRLFLTAIDAAGQTSAPQPIEVLQDSQPPSLFIDFPTNGMTLTTSNTVVAGRVGDLLSGFMGLDVTVTNLTVATGGNPGPEPVGGPAVVDVGIGNNGTYERLVPLAPGTNTLSVIASDKQGNFTSRQIEVVRVEAKGPQMFVVSGDRQMTNVHRRLAEPIVVRITQGDGLTPFPNKLVTFDVTRSDGRLLPLDPNAPLPTNSPSWTTNGALSLQVFTDADGLAKATWTLGSDSGCGNNRVCATSRDIAGSVFFCASATAAPARQINIGTGNTQRSEAGAVAPETLRVWVSDGCNGAAGVPVTFKVLQGGAQLLNVTGGQGASSITLPTSITGHAEVRCQLGPETGNNLIEASFPDNPGNPATFVLYGVARDPAKPTSFAGLVLDNASQPVGGANCVLTVGDRQFAASTDVAGQFRFLGIPSGPGRLFVDGLVATNLNGQTIPQGSYPFLLFNVVLIPNAENSLATPALLPKLDPNNARLYDGTKDLELTCEGVAGLKMLLKAGSMRRVDGTKPSPQNPQIVSLNQVHFDKVPMPLPDGAAPPFTWTLQPAMSTFDPPVQIEYPNMSGLPAGAIAYFLSFNHDTEKFEIVASGHVTDDSAAILTDPGAGLSVAGWGCNCPPYSVAGQCQQCRVAIDRPTTEACVNELVTYSASGGPMPGSFSWAGGTAVSGNSGSVYQTRFSSPGLHTVSVTYTCSQTGQSDQRSVSVRVAAASLRFASLETGQAYLEPWADSDAIAPPDRFRFLVGNPLRQPVRTISVMLCGGSASPPGYTYRVTSLNTPPTEPPRTGPLVGGCFPFTPHADAQNRPDPWAFCGERGPPCPIPGLRMSVEVFDASAVRIAEATVSQDLVDRMRQEYIDSEIHHGTQFTDGSVGLPDGAPPRGLIFSNAQLVGSEANYGALIWDQGFRRVFDDLSAALPAWSLHLNSGHRSPTHNRRSGGVLNSDHQWGKAADISHNAPFGSRDAWFGLYSEAILQTSGQVILEHNSLRLLPTRWLPPGIDQEVGNAVYRLRFVDSTPADSVADGYEVLSGDPPATLQYNGQTLRLLPSAQSIGEYRLEWTRGTTAVIVPASEMFVHSAQGGATHVHVEADARHLPTANSSSVISLAGPKPTLGPPAELEEAMNESWQITVAGQTATANPNGSFLIPNIAAADQFGPGGPGSAPDFLSDDILRLTGVSTAGGKTRYVYSEPFQIESRRIGFGENVPVTYSIRELIFRDTPPPLPQTMTMTIPTSVLTTLGQTAQLNVRATLGDGTIQDFTSRSNLTVYRTSNSRVVTVDADGKVTAYAEGLAYLTAVNEGTTAVVPVAVAPVETLTTVQGFARFSDGRPAEGADVEVPAFGLRARVAADGSFAVGGVPARLGPLQIVVTVTEFGRRFAGGSGSLNGIAGAMTDAGIIHLSPLLAPRSSMAAGFAHMVALRADGTLWSWGGNLWGQLGDGTVEPRSPPAQVGTASDWIAVAATPWLGRDTQPYGGTFALKRDGSLWAWGLNAPAQQGVPAGPTQIGVDHDWVGINQGYAIKADGTLWSVDRYSGAPRQFGTANDWAAISASEDHMLAVKNDGSLWAWGYNWYGQLGDGATQHRFEPGRVGIDTDWVAVAAGANHSLGLKANGTLWAWGNNATGQLGTGDNTDRRNPTRIGLRTDWKAISAGTLHSVGLRSEGSLWVWGRNRHGQLGLGADVDVWQPTQVGTSTNWSAIAAGSSLTAALTTEGQIWTSGANSFGQLGFDPPGNAAVPVPVRVSPATRWLTVAAGANHSVALASDGSLWQLGAQSANGAVPDSRTPRTIAGGGGWRTVAAGSYFSAAIQNNGSLWTWGSNSDGQLGNGGSTEVFSPTAIQTAFKWRTVDCGATRSAALQTDGSLWEWGGTPTQTSAERDWLKTVVGYSDRLALKGNGTLWGWGTYYDAPTQLASGSDWIAIGAGYVRGFALRQDGSLWSWGIAQFSPDVQRVGLENDWLSLSVGAYHTLALKRNGSLWAWGENALGQLGVGDHSARTIPVRVGNDTDWVGVFAGVSHSHAIRRDGTLWSWGDNFNGQLGIDLGITNRLTRVGDANDWGLPDVSPGVPPTIPGNPAVLQLVVGEDRTLRPGVSGSLPFQFQWLFNGLISPGRTDATLRLLPALPQDSGEYAVIVSNPWGSVTGTVASVTVVSAAPTILRQPASKTVQEGGDVGLAVVATGGPPPAYQWFFNDQAIPQARGPELLLTWVTQQSAGQYTVQVSNAVGTTTSTAAAITVETTSPLIVEQPESHSGYLKGPTKFWASALGTPPLSYQWRFKGADLADATNAVLRIARAGQADEGEYSVVVSNGGGSVESAQATLTLLPARPEDLLAEALNAEELAWSTSSDTPWFPQSDVTHDGISAAQSGSLSSSGSSVLQTTVQGPGQLSFWWMIQASSFDPDGNPPDMLSFHAEPTWGDTYRSLDGWSGWDWQQETMDLPGGSHTLVWEYITFNPQGTFGNAGWADEVTFIPLPPSPPIIFSQPHSFDALVDESVIFEVKARGNPDPSYQWQHQGNDIPGATNPYLSFNALTLDHAGLYTVVVSNSLGTAISDPASLVVRLAAPTITTHPANQTVLAGATVWFDASVRGGPRPELRWRFGGADIPGMTNSYLQLVNVTKKEEGNYTLFASNSQGAAESNPAKLTVQLTPPVITRQPTSTTGVVGGTVVLEVIALGGPPPTYQWQFGGIDIAGATSNQLNLQDLGMEDAGVYRVIVSNETGTVTSDPATVTVVEGSSLGEALNAPELQWTTGGDADWQVVLDVTHDGGAAARSGAISDGQASRLDTAVTGPGTLTFYWRVSSESCCDWLELGVDDLPVAQIAGEVEWQTQSVDIDPGDHRVSWVYRKDGSVIEGQDAAWLDEVSYLRR